MNKKRTIAFPNSSLSTNESPDERSATLILDGKEFQLKRFILSGVNPEGKGIIFTWNCSPDEIAVLNQKLNAVVNFRLVQVLNLE